MGMNISTGKAFGFLIKMENRSIPCIWQGEIAGYIFQTGSGIMLFV